MLLVTRTPLLPQLRGAICLDLTGLRGHCAAPGAPFHKIVACSGVLPILTLNPMAWMQEEPAQVVSFQVPPSLVPWVLSGKRQPADPVEKRIPLGGPTN